MLCCAVLRGRRTGGPTVETGVQQWWTPWSSSTHARGEIRAAGGGRVPLPNYRLGGEADRPAGRPAGRQAEGGVEQMGRKEKIFQLAKGYRGRAKNCITASRARVEKGLQYAYRDRRTKKREFRSLWITRVNAGVRGASGPPCVAPGRWA